MAELSLNALELYLAHGMPTDDAGLREYDALVARARDIMGGLHRSHGDTLSRADVEAYLEQHLPKIQQLVALIISGGGYRPGLDEEVANTLRVLAAIDSFFLQTTGQGLGQPYEKYSQCLVFVDAELNDLISHDQGAHLHRQPATRLQGEAAQIVEDSGYLNSAELPSFRTLTPEANFPLMMQSLVNLVAGFFPAETADKLRNLNFSVYRSRHVRSMVSNFLGSWSKDMHTLWRAVQNVEDQANKFKIAQVVLDFLAAYTGIDRQTDTQPFAAKPFSFQDFDLDVFAEGAVVKGRLNQDMTIMQVKGAIRDGRLVLTPQGEAFVEQVWQLYTKIWHHKNERTIITLRGIFEKLAGLKITPYGPWNYADGLGHPGDLVVGDTRKSVDEQFTAMRKLASERQINDAFRRQAEAFQQGFISDAPSTQRKKVLFADRPVSPPWVAGDGLSGEIGFHLVRELIEAGIPTYAPATTRARSMVAAAASYLALHADRWQEPVPLDQPHIIRGAEVYVGAANVLEPSRFAATVDQTMPQGSKGLFASLAYAAGQEQEPLLVTSGAKAVEALASHNRIGAVLRLQSPSTPNAIKNDITEFQGPWYVLGQWAKELATIAESSTGLKVQLPRWPIVRTWSLEQSPLMQRVLDYAGQFGITTFLARAAGSQAFISVMNLLNRDSPHSREPFAAVNDGGAMAHPKRLNSLLISAFIASLKPTKKPEEAVVARVHQEPRLQVGSLAGDHTLSLYLMGLTGARRGGTFTASNPAEFEYVVSNLRGPLAMAISGSHSALTIQRGSHDFVGSRLAKMLMRIGSFFNRDILGAFEFGVSFPGKRVRGSFLTSLIFGLYKPQEGDKIFIKTNSAEQLEEVVVMAANGDRVVFALGGDGSIEQTISLNAALKENTATEDFVIRYTYNPKQRILVQQVPVNVNREIVGKKYALPAEAGAVVRDADDTALAGSWPTKLRTFAGLQLGNPQNSVTYLAQRGVVDALKFLTDRQTETGIDVSSVTIHALKFSGNPTMDVASLVQVERRLEIREVYAAQKGRSGGEMVVADLITANYDGTELNRVEIQIFVRLNKGEGHAEPMVVPFVKPQNWHKVSHGFDRLHTFMTAAELQTYAAHVGDNNVIHLSDLAGRATMKSGAISPGFAIAAELEAFFRRRFRAARVENLEVVNQGDILPGETYQIRAKPSDADATMYEFQVVQREGRKSKVRVHGRAKLALLPEKSVDDISRARTVTIPPNIAGGGGIATEAAIDHSPHPLAEPVSTDEVADSSLETTGFASGDQSGPLPAAVFGGGMAPAALIARPAAFSRAVLGL